MKKVYKVFFAIPMFVILASAISCNGKKAVNITKSTNENILSIIEKYCKIATVKSDGTFIFEANLCNNDPSIENTVLMGGAFYNKDGKVQTGGGTVSINNHELIPNSTGSYGFDKVVGKTGLYGDTVTFTLHTPKQHQAASQMLNPNSPTAAVPSDGTTVTASIYSPAVVSITNNPGGLIYGASTAITWNTDAKNTNGVVIIAEYLPKRYVNNAAFAAGHGTAMEASMVVTDNGSATVPWSFFSSFPPNGHVILWVARGNYTIATDGTYNYQVGGYSAAAIWDVVIPTAPATTTNPPTIKKPTPNNPAVDTIQSAL